MAASVGVLGGLAALAWALLAVRLVRLARRPEYRFLEGAPDPAAGLDAGSVAAVVPARNEAEHVAATVAALRRQDYPDLRITLVDDESTDATLLIARGLADEPGRPEAAPLRVVAGVPRPAGWVGKTWAVHQGAADAAVVGADWLWFVDADMGLDPRALRTALAEAGASGADFVSLMPGVECRTFWQSTVAVSFLHILAHLFPLHRVHDPGRPEALAAGGFILVRRSLYERIGGHEAVRHAIVEDIELARLAKRAGGRLRIRLAPKLAWTHMYGSFRAIWAGLRKNAYAGMDFLPHKFVVGAIVALALAWAPALTLAVGSGAGSTVLVAVGLLGVLAQVAATWPNARFAGVRPWYGLALPLGITAYVAISTASAWHYHRGRVLWKGRSIDAATVVGASARAPIPENSTKMGQLVPKRR